LKEQRFQLKNDPKGKSEKQFCNPMDGIKERLGSIALLLTCYLFLGKSFSILYFTGEMKLWV